MRLSGQTSTNPRRQRLPGKPDAESLTSGSKSRVGALITGTIAAASSIVVPLAAAAVGVAAVSVASDVHAGSESVQHLDQSLTSVLQLGALGGASGADAQTGDGVEALQAIAPGVQAVSTVAQQIADANVDYAAFAALAHKLQQSNLPKLIESVSDLAAHLDRLRVNQQITFQTNGVGQSQPDGAADAAHPSP